MSLTGSSTILLYRIARLTVKPIISQNRRAFHICRSFSSSASTAPTQRRRRPRFETLKTSGTSLRFGRLETPYEHDEESMEDYLKKASLSPWVPLSDAAARKIFDLAQSTTDDVHIDLGSGDGRVCFHAIDFGVAKSTGIDVDEGIVQVARDRLAKRHPPPPLEFVVADLLDPDHKVWELVQEATLITMYFARDALQMFRPLLEQKLVGRQCKIITCGYEMPGWESTQFEVVLGTQLHLYKWGSLLEDEDLPFIDNILATKPKELEKDDMSGAFQGANVIDRTNPIRGFNPRLIEEMNNYDDEEDDEDWGDEDNELQMQKGDDTERRHGIDLSRR